MQQAGGGDDLEYVVRGTHRSLVPTLPDDGEADLVAPTGQEGLVVVPVSRVEPLLDTAAALAHSHQWPLLLLCSRDNNARRVHRRLSRDWPEVEVTAGDLLHDDLLRAHREWLTADHPASRQRLEVDLNRKRNLGLAAARMTGRSAVLFVDDDVRGLVSAHTGAALRQLREPRCLVASWPLKHFPDNSVVHHARRDFLHLEQDVFIGAGALLVGLDTWTPPGFPPIYNEDWLFLYRPIEGRQVLAGPDIGQTPYDPYDSPARAAHQEFGDVLGEGLYHLLHTGHRLKAARHGHYWKSVHGKRSKLLKHIVHELRSRHERSGSAEERAGLTRALAAIEEARKQLTRATPESLADFVRRWQHDEDTWAEFYDRLPERDTLKEALVYLGLHEAWIVSSSSAQRVERAEDVS